MLKRKRLLPGILTATLVIGLSTPAPAQEGRKPDADVKKADPAATGDGAQQFCANVVNIAADEAESKEWIAKREEFMKKAEDGVVAVYAKMEPEAAAAQLLLMDEAMAAALLSKLNPRVSSAILDEMDAGKAAKLTDLMSASGAPAANRKKS
jgi:hypothetical protein